MRRLAIVIVLGLAAVAHAQLVPAGPFGGCPEAWHHRDGDRSSFSCRDTTTGAFCNGDRRAPAGATQVDEVTATRADLRARGFVIDREGDEDGMHFVVYDDAAGHRIARFVRRGAGSTAVVECGSHPTSFDPQWSLFVSVAQTAR